MSGVRASQGVLPDRAPELLRQHACRRGCKGCAAQRGGAGIPVPRVVRAAHRGGARSGPVRAREGAWARGERAAAPVFGVRRRRRKRRGHGDVQDRRSRHGGARACGGGRRGARDGRAWTRLPAHLQGRASSRGRRLRRGAASLPREAHGARRARGLRTSSPLRGRANEGRSSRRRPFRGSWRGGAHRHERRQRRREGLRDCAARRDSRGA